MKNDVIAALAGVGESQKQRALAFFNKASGAAIGILGYVDPSTLNNEHYTYVEIQCDLFNDRIRGTLDNYEIYNPENEEIPTIDEAALNAQAQAKVLSEYPLARQLNVLRDVVKTIVEQLDLKAADHPAIAALQEMDGFIEDVLQNNTSRKNYFANSPDFNYVSDEQLAEKLEAQLEGGLHEVYGARRVELLPGV